MYLQKPGQAEDELTEMNCKKGYEAVPLLQVQCIKHCIISLQDENLSAYDLIRNNLDDRVMQTLAQFAENIINHQSHIQIPRYLNV